MQCTENGFQTFEVLREGLWASFTGGWFYDLRQNVFCNTFHLYLWLFLLCFPFIVHLYFPPTTLVSSFYCGTVGVLFLFLKLINHRLHKIFDTSECIQESIPGEYLPESQKKLTNTNTEKASEDDEWYELKEFINNKITSDIPSHTSFQGGTDDDSINSSETAGRPVSSTIDLKVDVHHKNISESSEDLSLKPVIEDEIAGAATEAAAAAAAALPSEYCGLLPKEKVTTPDSAGSSFRIKTNQLQNNKHRLKNEEGMFGIQDSDLVLSLSDCHIAQMRSDSMDELSKECKISQSECHITKCFLSNEKEQKMTENHSLIPAEMKKIGNRNKDHNKKRYRKGFTRHLGANTQNEDNSMTSDKKDCYEMGNLASNGSFGLLTLNQNNREQLKNTGSLELPLKDSDTSPLEKGLLYWKQQHLDSNRVDNLREGQNVLMRPTKLQVSSESNIHTADSLDADNSIKRLNKKTDFRKRGDKKRKDKNEFASLDLLDEDISSSEYKSEKAFLRILEENFDWYSSEYQNEKPDKLNYVKSKINEISKFKSDEDIREDDYDNLPRRSCIKFQVDSDDDSSDNCGSRSPLLCRHESLEKETKEKKSFTYNDKGGKKIARTFSNEENNGHKISKMVRTLSADEDVVLSRNYKTSEALPKVERGFFGSVLLSVYDDNDVKNSEDDGKNRGPQRESGKEKETNPSSSKSTDDEEAPVYYCHKMCMTSPVRDNHSKTVDDRSDTKLGTLANKDVLSWSNERIGLEWLFENADNEPDNQTDQVRFASGSDKGATFKSSPSSSSLDKSMQNQGAIPKTRTKPIGKDRSSSKRRSHGSKSGRGKAKTKTYADEMETCDVAQMQKDLNRRRKSERETGIIDEEDMIMLQQRSGDNESRSENDDGEIKESPLGRRENYDSSNNSNFELSSLLPLSSILSSLNPPSSPLLAAFLATRKDLPAAAHQSCVENVAFPENESKRSNEEVLDYHPGLSRNRNKRIKRNHKFQRTPRSSTPLAALASMVSSNSGTHIATSHDDTTQGAMHCFQDERGNWMSYTFDNTSGGANAMPTVVPLNITNPDNGNSSRSGNCDYPNPMQPARRHSHVQNSWFWEGDPTYSNSRGGDDISRRQQHDPDPKRLDHSRGKVSQGTQARLRHHKFGEPYDSSINLVSNSNSENECSLSLNSTSVSPGVDACPPRNPYGYMREKVVQEVGDFNTNGVGDNNNITNCDSNNGSVVLSLSEFRSNDNNNNSGRNSNFYLEAPYNAQTETVLDRNRQRNILNNPSVASDFRFLFNAMQERGDRERKTSCFRFFDISVDSNGELKKRRNYYKLYYSPLNYIKIRFDRLELVSLLDRNLTVFEVVLSLLLSLAVSVCGITLLNYGFYRDLLALLFCFTIAGCHYSLLKSVQPDATSPTHGYNRIVIYSRSVYFCITSVIIILLSSSIDEKNGRAFNFYSLEMTNNQLFTTIRDLLINILLLFPMLFTLGIFPQINTFLLYLLEQIDMHILGGTAMSNLVGATFCILRSTAAVVLTYGFAFGALSEKKTSQHILFSIFCGLLITLSYHLSRSSSNPITLWEILKSHFLQDGITNYSSQYKESKGGKKTDGNKTVDESMTSGRSNRNDRDDKSDDKNSQNNLLLNSNPSSNETLKTIDTQIKSNFSENFDNSGNASDIYSMKKETEKEFVDPLPMKLKETVYARLINDAIVCCFISVLTFGLHSSTVFTTLQPDLNRILWGVAGFSGIVLHYVVPHLRKPLPWLCLARPILRPHEYNQFEVRQSAKVMWFEETYVIFCFLERNVLYPVLVMATVTYDSPKICESYGIAYGTLITVVCGLKMMRSAFSNTCQQYIIVLFTSLLFGFDFRDIRKTFLIDYFFMGIVISKIYELLLKMQFVATYIAPWQITWGSTFHAFAQLFSVPHSAILLLQTALSSLMSAPLNPFLGSAMFLTSYVRPIKFWERDYNTKRVDHSNTRLSSHLERNLGSDDNNLNSIFYEHLTRSLQHSLCGDLELGRWGPAYPGDCFILASDYLNCLVHIIEIGNGLVTFQMRGLEFRGTFCQQREVEAISEGVEENDGCCCCQPGHLPNFLSVNAAFSQRWLSWEVTSTKYVLEGYSISDNSAKSMLQTFDFRKVLVTYYVKSIIFYCVRSPKLHDWLSNPAILSALDSLSDRTFVDLDPVFNINIDQDFDLRAEGITRASFCYVYSDWIHYCASKREKRGYCLALVRSTCLPFLLLCWTYFRCLNQSPILQMKYRKIFYTRGPIHKSKDSQLISLCLALSLMGRRTLGTASHNTVSNVEFFLYGLHALFKGDFRVTSARDEWIFADIEFLKKVVAPGVRMSLKLHQDHFMSPEEYENPVALYEAISSHEENWVISHEGDPVWREAVLSGTPSLLALRHVLDDGADEYKIIMLNKRYLSFRVIKLNRECVRGLWAGQQQELIFFRNRNPERGSIQNAKQVLRNIINSSCDQPIGYPIYVSPLTTSYSDTNKQLTEVIGGPFSLQGLKGTALNLWYRIRQRCREGCSSGSAGNMDEGGFTFGHDGIHSSANINVSCGYGLNTSGSQSMDSSQTQLGGSNRGGSLGRSSVGGRGSLPSVGKPSSATLASLAGFISSAELPKGESFLRERETSVTFRDRTLPEEREASRRHEKFDDARSKSDEKDKHKEEGESRKEKKYEYSDDGKDKEFVSQRVKIIDPNQVFDAINLGRRIDVLWPDEGMRARGGRSHWKDWLPDTGMEGQVVHRWTPNNRDPSKRSNVDKTILLIKIGDRYVPIAEGGVQDLGAEV